MFPRDFLAAARTPTSRCWELGLARRARVAGGSTLDANLGLTKRLSGKTYAVRSNPLPASEEDDHISWSLEPSGVYSTNSMYLKLSQVVAVTHFVAYKGAAKDPGLPVATVQGKVAICTTSRQEDGPFERPLFSI
jgi:hypothetical protein